MGSKAVTLEQLKEAEKWMKLAEETFLMRKWEFLDILKRANSKLVKEFYTKGRS
jgi:hypothetical protein